MGKDGIIAEHPTLKVKYLDPEMARLSAELEEKLEEQRPKEEEPNSADDVIQPDGVLQEVPARFHCEPRKKVGIGGEWRL